ncbi:hypothetical protein BGZ65_001666, partial [Modicella reniformis]
MYSSHFVRNGEASRDFRLLVDFYRTTRSPTCVQLCNRSKNQLLQNKEKLYNRSKNQLLQNKENEVLTLFLTLIYAFYKHLQHLKTESETELETAQFSRPSIKREILNIPNRRIESDYPNSSTEESMESDYPNSSTEEPMGIISSSRDTLSPHQSLKLAKIHLENVNRVADNDIALVLCRNTEVLLRDAKRDEHEAMRDGVATAYISLGEILESRGYRTEAQASYKEAEKLGNTEPSVEGTLNSAVDSMAEKPPHKRPRNVAVVPHHIFPDNIRPPTITSKLPEADERLENTSQLAYCLSILPYRLLDETLEPIARNWLQAVENDSDEQERLELLATDVIRVFKNDEHKDANAVCEVVCLSPALEKDAYRGLLAQFYDGIAQSDLVHVHKLDGLAQLIQGADAGYLEADDLVKILRLLSKRLNDTRRSSKQMYQLTVAVSRVLDAMADTKVNGLDRQKLHEPLSSYLSKIKDSSDPYLVYQAAYAFQALQCIPDNEIPWQATLRRTGKVIQGMPGLLNAVKSLDLNKFIDGLEDIQQSSAGVFETVKTVYEGVSSFEDSGQSLLDCLKEGLSFGRKCVWYQALRGADVLICHGEFASFKKLVCEAACRLDPAFQLGVCQRLGDVAANPRWD